MSVSDYVSITALVVSVLALGISLLRNRWMSKQLKLSSAISVVDWLEAARPDRLKLYKVRDEKKPFNQWSEDEKTAANNITRKLDILGLLDSLGYLDQRFVDRFYAIPAKEVFEICRDWLNDERTRRGEQHLWEFQQLAQRIEAVKDNHPALAKTEHWLRNPRKRKRA